MYTPEYQKHLEKFAQAQRNFDANPCKETATILSNLREVKWKEVEKYTSEEIERRNIEEDKRIKAHISRMRNYANTIHIENMNESQGVKARMHKINDELNPINK